MTYICINYKAKLFLMETTNVSVVWTYSQYNNTASLMGFICGNVPIPEKVFQVVRM